MDATLLEEYITAHISPEPEVLTHVQRQVNLRLLYPRMCSGHLQGRLLSLLTALVRPKRALEVGTYAAYSTLAIAESLAHDARLHTVEIDDEMEPLIRRHLALSPHGAKVELHIGDIADLLPRIATEGSFDMAYLDANKRTYLETFQLIRPHLAPGALVIADNTLWDGKVVDPNAHDPQTLGIRRFNDFVAADPDLQTVMLPLRDGLTLIRVLK